jgi:hypothetical protein
MFTVSVKMKERFICLCSDSLSERYIKHTSCAVWTENCLPFAPVRIHSSRSVTYFHFIFVLINFDFVLWSGEMILQFWYPECRQRKYSWDSTNLFYTYIQRRTTPVKKSENCLVVRHRKPRKEFIHCCNPSGIKGKSRRWSDLERAQKEIVRQH